MKKILVLSDTHGNEAGIKKAIELAGKVDAVIHLGDYDRDTKCIKNQKVFSVKGNCDLGSTQKSKRIVTIGGKRILMVHGHKQRVKLGLLTLGLYAQEKGADIALFGHTHIPTQQYAGNVLLYNPGCLSSMRQTYGIMTIRDDGRVKIKTYHLVQ